MAVSFNDNIVVHDIPLSEDRSMGTDIIRESHRRTQIEKSVDIRTVKALIESWRLYPVNFVLGNLGRQPTLLHYFIDMYFQVHELIKVDAPFETEYQDPYPDFLFIVEPYFGYSVPPNAGGHVVVLCSHASLNLPKDTHFSYLHLVFPKNEIIVQATVKPPINHLETVKGNILDVTDATSAHEAYLRIWTGIEQCHPDKILVKQRDRDILQMHVDKIKHVMKERDWTGDFDFMPIVETV